MEREDQDKQVSLRIRHEKGKLDVKVPSITLCCSVEVSPERTEMSAATKAVSDEYADSPA